MRILAHDLRTPENVGSLFRLADAMAVEHLYLSGGTPAPPNSKLHRVARDTEKSVPFETLTQAEPTLHQLRQLGYRIVSLELTNRSIALANFRVQADEKLCLIAGSEQNGISDNLLVMSNDVVHIPMCGQNSSMNVAMACAIACYHITAQLQTR